MLVTVTWSPKSGVATGLEIQQFSANGELDNTFARSGSATIRSSLLLNPDIEPDVMVVNGPGTKQATVVIAAVGEIELLRVQT